MNLSPSIHCCPTPLKPFLNLTFQAQRLAEYSAVWFRSVKLSFATGNVSWPITNSWSLLRLMSAQSVCPVHPVSVAPASHPPHLQCSLVDNYLQSSIV